MFVCLFVFMFVCFKTNTVNTQVHFNRKYKFTAERILKGKKLKKVNTLLETYVNFCLLLLYGGIHTNTNKIISAEVI